MQPIALRTGRSPDPAWAHNFRMRARRILLSSIQSSRLDAEGTSAIDLEISSASEWSKWVNSLNPADFTILMIWRCGAIKTPTRRYFRPDEPPQKKMCPWCKHAQASARHFFTECSRFSQDRLALLWNLSIAFLLIGGDSSRGAPPNMGWITFQAASAFNVRVQLALAANKLGVTITKQMSDI